MQTQYYKPSGKSNALSFVITLLVSVLAAAVLGFGLGATTLHLPFVYFTVILVVLAAFGVGIVISFTGKMTKLMSTKAVVIIAFISSLVAVYANWVGYLYTFPDLNNPIVLNPVNQLDWLQDFAKHGVWSVKSFTPKGGVLYAFWGVEALIIIVVPLLAASSYLDTPFCEACNRWIEEKTAISNLEHVTDPEAVIADVERGNFDPIYKLKRNPTIEMQSTQLELICCMSCKKEKYLNLVAITVERKELNRVQSTIRSGTDSSMEKVEQNEDKFIENLIINDAQHDKLKNHWSENIPDSLDEFNALAGKQ